MAEQTLEKKAMDAKTFMEFEEVLNSLRDAEEEFDHMYNRAVETIEQGFLKVTGLALEAGRKARRLYQAANKYDVPTPFQPEIDQRQANIDSKMSELEEMKADRQAYLKRKDADRYDLLVEKLELNK